MTDAGDGSDGAGAADGAVEPDGLDAAAAFALLGDADRLEIVTVLHEASADWPVPFSTLADRVGVDDTGRFNYHLDRLVPHYVARGDDGYRLTAAGERVARAVVAGTYTVTPELDPFAIDGDCYACGEAALRASYADERFAIDCRACGEGVVDVAVPPTVVRGRDPQEALDAFDRWSRTQVELAGRGLCPDCGGAVEPGVSERTRENAPFDAVATYDCTVCDRTLVTSFGMAARRAPAVEAFHRQRGRSVLDRPYWEVGQCVAGDRVRVVSRDPWLIRVTFVADGDACRVDVDADLTVARTEIVPGGAPDD